MKNFNIIVIVSFAFIFLIASGCSKEEESPYTREQIIGKWFNESYYIEDRYGNGKWVDEPRFGESYNQYNADGTYYTYYMSSNKSTWSLNGKNLIMKLHFISEDRYTINRFEIEELTGRTLILNTKKKYPNTSKIKYINEKYMNEEN